MLAVFSLYQEITAEIIGVCETVARIVSPVVCNSSPEGFLPRSRSLVRSVILKMRICLERDIIYKQFDCCKSSISEFCYLYFIECVMHFKNSNS